MRDIRPFVIPIGFSLYKPIILPQFCEDIVKFRLRSINNAFTHYFLVRGALAVQRFTHLSIIYHQKPVAFSLQIAYAIAHSSWMVTVGSVFPRPHNPSVAGSSPACPILSTDTSNGVFGDHAITSISSFYANITHSTGKDWSNPAQKIHLYVNLRSHFQIPKKVEKPLIRLLPILTLELQSGPKPYQIFLQLRKKCVILRDIHHFLDNTQGFLVIDQRIIDPLFYIIVVYARVNFFIRRSHGKH